MTLTFAEWRALPAARRLISEKRRYVLTLDATSGATVLEPVEIVTGTTQQRREA